MSKSSRNIFLDVLRGMAILFVVFGHAIQSANNMNPGLPLQKIIMTFWMPLFFMISGYVDGFTHGGKGILSKINRLVVPYFFWATIVFVLDVLIGKNLFSFGAFLTELGFSQFWFLRVLFIIWFIFYLARLVYSYLSLRVSYVVNILITSLSFTILLITISSFMGFGILKYSMLYFVGLCIFWVLKNINFYFRLYIAFVCFIMFCVSSSLLFIIDNVCLKRLLDISMAFTGSGMVCFVALLIVRFKNSVLCRILSYCGKISLELYAVHWCLLFNTNLLGLNCVKNIGYNVYLVSMSGFLLWVIISIAFIYLIKAIPGGDCVFSGFKFLNQRKR